MARYTLGLDYGTNSVRAIVVDVADGKEIGQAVWTYEHGDEGVLLSDEPNLARQHPADYLRGAEKVIVKALAEAGKKRKKFKPGMVIGVGVDTTGSTPMPVDRHGEPLTADDRFAGDLDAMAWLWKDHTSGDEAAEITHLARQVRPHYLDKCGGTYSSEWFWSKILHCLRTSPEVFEAAWSWVEIADWIPAVLTGTQAPGRTTAGVCAAGHKAMYSHLWGGYPDAEFLGRLDERLATLRDRLADQAVAVDTPAGRLTSEWARRTGLPEGIPVVGGAFDAHLGAVGAGVRPGTMVKIMGTSSCDLTVAPAGESIPDVPGMCGQVLGSVLPGCWALEAGQSAMGDVYNWFVDRVRPGGKKSGSHKALSKKAAQLAPGQSGLLALDWNNGNRCILVDPKLTGLLLGQTLHTTGAEVYRALIEATAFGSRKIIDQARVHGVAIDRIVACGGIAEKNPLVMQIFADVLGMPMHVSRSAQTCALGSAVAAAVVAGAQAGGYDEFASAQEAMTGLKKKAYHPDPQAHGVYNELYFLYTQLHDCFGTNSWQGDCSNVMKRLIEIRDRSRL
jgi:L-ribulokinase